MISNLLFAGLCSLWSGPVTLGLLDRKVLPEASGLVSIGFHLYQINDSDSTGMIYKTDLKGRVLKKIRVKDVEVNDWEELQEGPCGADRCLYIGDIGDNQRGRKSIDIYALKLREVETLAEVTPFKKLTFSYPDGSHNSEAFVVDPSGVIFVFTKAISPFEYAPTSTRVYRAIADRAEMEYWSEFPLDPVLTGASLSNDGKKLVLLSYSQFTEILFDSKNPQSLSNPLKMSQNSVKKIPQPEAISYNSNSKSDFTRPELFVSSETFADFDPPLVGFNCLR